MSKQMVIVGVGVLGVLVGSIVGYIASETLQEPQEVVTQTQVVQEELSNEDLEELCKGLTDEEKKNVLEVQEEVKSLQLQLADREAELDKLKAQKHSTEKGSPGCSCEMESDGRTDRHVANSIGCSRAGAR